MIHQFPVRVYYEDTDLAGIVYYANYLKFIERARSTMVLDAGINQLGLQMDGVIFVVRKVEADYLGSAKLNDDLRVETELKRVTGAKIIFTQNIYLDDALIFSALVTVVCVTKLGKVTRFPADIRAKFEELAN